MARMIPNSFTEYELTPNEQRSGMLLSEQQKMVLQNRLSTYAKQKLNVLYNASNPVASMQEEAEIMGQISAIQAILDDCQTAETDIAEEAAEAAGNSNQ